LSTKDLNPRLPALRASMLTAGAKGARHQSVWCTNIRWTCHTIEKEVVSDSSSLLACTCTTISCRDLTSGLHYFRQALIWPWQNIGSNYPELSIVTSITAVCWPPTPKFPRSCPADDGLCLLPFSKRSKSHGDYSSAIKMPGCKFSCNFNYYGRISNDSWKPLSVAKDSCSRAAQLLVVHGRPLA